MHEYSERMEEKKKAEGSEWKCRECEKLINSLKREALIVQGKHEATVQRYQDTLHECITKERVSSEKLNTSFVEKLELINEKIVAEQGRDERDKKIEKLEGLLSSQTQQIDKWSDQWTIMEEKLDQRNLRINDLEKIILNRRICDAKNDQQHAEHNRYTNAMEQNEALNKEIEYLTMRTTKLEEQRARLVESMAEKEVYWKQEMDKLMAKIQMVEKEKQIETDGYKFASEENMKLQIKYCELDYELQKTREELMTKSVAEVSYKTASMVNQNAQMFNIQLKEENSALKQQNQELQQKVREHVIDNQTLRKQTRTGAPSQMENSKMLEQQLKKSKELEIENEDIKEVLTVMKLQAESNQTDFQQEREARESLHQEKEALQKRVDEILNVFDGCNIEALKYPTLETKITSNINKDDSSYHDTAKAKGSPNPCTGQYGSLPSPSSSSLDQNGFNHRSVGAPASSKPGTGLRGVTAASAAVAVVRSRSESPAQDDQAGWQYDNIGETDRSEGLKAGMPEAGMPANNECPNCSAVYPEQHTLQEHWLRCDSGYDLIS